MTSRLAALVAACFAVAVSQPRTGVVVHRHGGGDHPHVHVHPGEDADHQHAGHHDTDDDHADHHHHHDDEADYPHDVVAQNDHPAAPHHHDDAGPGLRVAGGGFGWHAHSTEPFQRATPTPPPALAPPQAGMRLVLPRPCHRGAAEPIPGRSRAPPALQSS